ncbi:hypothetical protein RD1_3554 [Roseobacter denitrificans OCh 114]|uniref:Uncharacterized protein n=1 Tax=Roseobacter denitrificans (strain ATCC 33942 / OCh 114) TaxID=375451 RepID=Q162Q9_ROSDO|nr:hypothetical protein RD1_3554 [Roseobacter denitrificans OCh 114]
MSVDRKVAQALFGQALKVIQRFLNTAPVAHDFEGGLLFGPCAGDMPLQDQKGDPDHDVFFLLSHPVGVRQNDRGQRHHVCTPQGTGLRSLVNARLGHCAGGAGYRQQKRAAEAFQKTLNVMVDIDLSIPLIFRRFSLMNLPTSASFGIYIFINRSYSPLVE